MQREPHNLKFTTKSSAPSPIMSHFQNVGSLVPERILQKLVQGDEIYDLPEDMDCYPTATESRLQSAFDSSKFMFQAAGIPDSEINLYMPSESQRQLEKGTKISLFFDNCPNKRMRLEIWGSFVNVDMGFGYGSAPISEPTYVVWNEDHGEVSTVRFVQVHDPSCVRDWTSPAVKPYECRCCSHLNDGTTGSCLVFASNDFLTANDERRSMISFDFLEKFNYDVGSVESTGGKPALVYGSNFMRDDETKCHVLGRLKSLPIELLGQRAVLEGVLICDNLPVPLHICKDSIVGEDGAPFSTSCDLLAGGFEIPEEYQNHPYWQPSNVIVLGTAKFPIAEPLAERDFASYYPNTGSMTKVEVRLSTVGEVTIRLDDDADQTLAKMVNIDTRFIKQAAKQLGYKQRRVEASKTLFFEGVDADGNRVLVDVYYTTKALKTCLDHPRQGQNELWRSEAYRSFLDLIELLKKPRKHTARGYRKASNASKKCNGCFKMVGRDGFSQNQWMKAVGRECKVCIERRASKRRYVVGNKKRG